LGPKRGDRVEIVSGLSPGELVVAQPSVSLHDGSRVSVGEGK
jgi:multidrug efflux pump subunit AcrA (membrane-fusion protein)